MKPQTPNNLWIAASDGDIEQVKHFLSLPEYNVNSQDENGYCALSAAVSYDHLELAEYLIKEGADVMLSDWDKETPLHHCESKRCAELLIHNGADPNTLNSDGKYPYQSAYEEENMELFEYLKQFSNNVQIEDSMRHVEYDGKQVDLDDTFLNHFDQVMKNNELDESTKDEQLGAIVLDLITKNIKKEEDK